MKPTKKTAVESPPVVDEVAVQPEAETVQDTPLVVDEGEQKTEQESAVSAPSLAIASLRPARLGRVDCLVGEASVEGILSSFTAEQSERVVTLASSLTAAEAGKAMLGTDGRYTPCVFTGEDDGSNASFLSGFNRIAAALASGKEVIDVVVVAVSQVGFVLGALSELARSPKKSGADDDEDLIWRAHADD